MRFIAKFGNKGSDFNPLFSFFANFENKLESKLIMNRLMQQTSQRAGTYVAQPKGYIAFEPSLLPPDPPITYDDKLLEQLSRADRALGRLDGSTDILPNPDLFVMMYVRKEAVLSSQIEGTQASLADVLELESNVYDTEKPSDVSDVINYVTAMN